VASGYTSGRCRPQGYSKAQHRLKCLGRCGLPDLFAQFDDAMSFATLSKAGLSRPYGTNFFLGPCERAKRHAARNGPSPSCISESRLTTVLHDMQGPCSSPLPNAHLQCLLLWETSGCSQHGSERERRDCRLSCLVVCLYIGTVVLSGFPRLVGYFSARLCSRCYNHYLVGAGCGIKYYDRYRKTHALCVRPSQ